MKRFLSITISILFFLGLSAEEIIIEKVETNGLTIGPLVSKSISQDANGQIWLGTRIGLYSYNGSGIHQEYPDETLKDELLNFRVSMITQTNEGNIAMLLGETLYVYESNSGKYLKYPEVPLKTLSLSTDGLWCANDNIIYSFCGEKFIKHITIDTKYSICVLLEASDYLYIGTVCGKVFRIDNHKQTSLIYSSNNSRINNIYCDTYQNLWISTEGDGLVRISSKDFSIKEFRHNPLSVNSISKNNVRTVCEDQLGNLWIATKDGLNRYDYSSNKIVRIRNSVLENNSIWDIYKDKHGTLWLGTFFGGLYNFNPQSQIYKNLYVVQSKHVSLPVLGQIIKDKQNNLWVASEGNGLLYINPKTNEKKFYNNNVKAESILAYNNIRRMSYDSINNSIYLATHLGGLYRFNINSKTFAHIVDPNFPQLKDVIAHDIIRYKNMYICSSRAGLFFYNPASNRFKHVAKYLLDPTCCLLDNDILWVEERSILYCYDVNKLIAEQDDALLKTFSKKQGTLNGKYINRLFKDSNKNIWIAYEDNGLEQIILDYKDRTKIINSNQFNSRNSGFIGNSVYTIAETNSGYILAGTENELVLINTKDKISISYSEKNGFPITSMFTGGIYNNKNGTIYISGINGIIEISENNLLLPSKPFSIWISDIKINNKEVERNSNIRSSIYKSKKLNLSHNQNTVEIAFSSDNYSSKHDIRYKYMLEGFDKQWIEAYHEKSIVYTNLNHGRYKLKIIGSSIASPNNKFEYVLDVTINPPFYRTWAAYMLYLILAVVIAVIIIYTYRSRLLLQTSLYLERREKEQIAMANHSKLQFFTNISHEFRTPLTLIIGLIDQILETMSIQPSLYNKVLKIQQNAQRMQNLITELIDFRKQEQGYLKLKIAEHDLNMFSNEMFNSFIEYASFLNINYSFEGADEELVVWLDNAQMQKVLYNILSNAFKNTPAGGTIILSVKKLDKKVQISIRDTGKGMSKEVVERIFDRFYQAENPVFSAMTPGSGIGLALTKGIVDAHHGKIVVESEEGKGTIMSIIIPMGDDHFSNDSHVTKTILEDADLRCIRSIKDFKVDISEALPFDGSTKYNVVVVEDNDELRSLIVEVFSQIASVSEANNGFEGYNLILEKQPDLVVSDIVMPIMNGYELCSKLKSTIETSHIPIILLTALNTTEQSIEGYNYGADDYVTKPFNKKLLLSRAVNLINNRKQIKEKYSRQIEVLDAQQQISNNIDQVFLDKAITVVENNLENEEFNAKTFAQEMGMSQTALYNKLKGLVELTITDFILKIRLRRAVQLIKTRPDLTISEISYQLCFCNPKYFTKCFKAQYNQLPTQLRK